ncbi:MAG: nucleoside monophosphate kinase [Candidatus Krumholzibacteriales bacterium]
MRIVLLGKPGAGKGTQAARLREGFGYYHLSSGEALREEINRGTDLGREIKQYVEKGEIGPEKLIARLVLDFIDEKDIGKNLLLDGFPRTLYQAEKLDERYPPDLCLLLDISDSESITRLSNRYVCRDCGKLYQNRESGSPAKECGECGGRLVQREDDTPEAIQNRLRVFREEVNPVINHYREQGRLVTLDGSLPREEIHNNIKFAIMKIVGPN